MVKAPALRPAGDGSYAKKKCPRCGEMLFADMTTCYGCLYDFTRGGVPTGGRPEDGKPAGRPEGVETPGVLEGLEEPEGFAEPEGLAGPERFAENAPCSSPTAAPVAPLVRAPVCWEADDEATTVLDDRSRERRPHGVWVRSQAIEVFVPLGAEGLSVGRGAGNQIVLHERSVSRRHLRLSPTDSGRGVEAVDLGATNPATVDGEPITSSVFVPWGKGVRVGGVTLAVCE